MKIAVVKLSAMGDIIHSMVVLQFIKKYNSAIEIDWVVEEGLKDILEYNPDINNIITLNLKSLKKNKSNIVKEIKKVLHYRKNSYDIVIDAQGLLKSAIVARLLGKNVVGFSKNSLREKIASYLYDTTYEISYASNVIERNFKLVGHFLGFSLSQNDLLSKKPFLFFKDDYTIDYLSDTQRNILFIVGASKPNKMYPTNSFIEVAQKLSENILIAWGNEKEKKIAEDIKKELPDIVICPKLSLNALKMLISKVDLVIGGDTGPTHMAWALNRPSITIFGNTPAYRNAYVTKINKVVKSDTYVNPYKLNKGDFSIKTIKPSQIVTIAKQLLQQC